MSETKVIVITTVVDEEWMMERFLSTFSAIADHILIHDESTGIDRTREIYKKYPKTTVFTNDGPPIRFDIKRRWIFEEARKIPCDRRVIIAADADEVLSANVLDSPEWKQILKADPGTLFHMQWVTLWGDISRYRIDHPTQYGIYNRHIWVDDGVSQIPEVGEKGFHMVYTPQSAKKHVHLQEVVSLHYQFCNFPRMESKHRYYRAHEKVRIGKLSDLGIERTYGYMNSARIQTRPSKPEWFAGWEARGIDVRTIPPEPISHWDVTTLKYLQEHGAETFGYQDVWRAEWSEVHSFAVKRGLIAPDSPIPSFRPKLGHRLFRGYSALTLDWKPIRWLERKLFRNGFQYQPQPLREKLRQRLKLPPLSGHKK